jgi:Flp pilus assembly protein TadB
MNALMTKPGLRLTSSDLIRASTYSPVEWRIHQQAKLTWYQRWVRPMIVVVTRRFHLKPAAISPNFLVQAGLEGEGVDAVELTAIRLMCSLAGAVLGVATGIVVSGSFALVPLLAWLGYIAPMRTLGARRQRRQAAIMADLPELISMVRAFVSAGMPLERSLHVLSTATSPDTILKREIRRALASYGLGLTIEQALEEMGPRTGVDDLDAFVTALSQSKRSGVGLDSSLRDLELMVRMNRRNRATAQAASVGTKLLAVLAGIYLPEFVILIVIPLFWGIMQRAFG